MSPSHRSRAAPATTPRGSLCAREPVEPSARQILLYQRCPAVFSFSQLLFSLLLHTFGPYIRSVANKKCAFIPIDVGAGTGVGTAGTARDARFGVSSNARRPRQCRATLTIQRGGASGVEGVEHGRRGDAMRRARSSQSQYSRCSEDRRRGR